MKNNKEPNSRRKVLLGLAAGGAAGASQLPGSWVKPVVNAVALPAHAATTQPGDEPGEGTTTTTAPTTTPCPDFDFRGNIILTSSTQPSKTAMQTSLPQQLFDTVLPSAMASPAGTEGDLCIQTSECGTLYSAKLRYAFDGDNYHEVSGKIGEPAIVFTRTLGCFIDLMLEVPSTSAAGANYKITGEYASADLLPVGVGCPSEPADPCESQE